MSALAKLPCYLPTASIPEFLDLDALANYVKSAFAVLGEDDFVQDALWRDTFALSGTLRTFYSSRSIAAAWKATAKARKPTSFVIDGTPRVVRAGPSAWVEISLTFETKGVPATTSYAYVSVIPDQSGKWKIWIFRTILEQLTSQPNVDVLEPVYDVSAMANGDASTNGAVHEDDAVTSSRMRHADVDGAGPNGIATNGVTTENTGGKVDYDCVIIGGGQAGLSTAGRLKALGVSYLILEKHDQVGDNWHTRYDSMRLHTVREFAHLPFERTFPRTYQEWLTKGDLAEGYRRWAKTYDINISLSTTLLSGSWIAEKEIWDLEILCHGQESHITSSFVVFAVGGGSQFPVLPTYEDRHLFHGVTLHSGDYKSATEWSGKHGMVVGTANTGHDVAEDMLRAGLKSVTMVQRSKTLVVPAEHYREVHDRVYNEKIPTTVADRLFCTGPTVLGRIMGSRMLRGKAALEPERFDSLERAGFKLDRDGDMASYLFGRFGGYYLDVGASAKISKGLIKIKSDSLPVRYVEDGLICANGDHLVADVIVFATGFVGNLKVVVAELFGHDLANQLQDYWGLDEEGELKGAFKPCGHPAFWYMGGAVGQARYMSRFIALQIKAKLRGTPFPVYTESPPRNSSLNKMEASQT